MLLGFELAHIGINAADEHKSMAVAEMFGRGFHFAIKKGNSSNFASSGIEVNKSPGLGEYGHIAIRTNSIKRAATTSASADMRWTGAQEKAPEEGRLRFTLRTPSEDLQYTYCKNNGVVIKG